MNGYITINIEGKEHQLFFGYSAHKAFINSVKQFKDQCLDETGGLTDFGLCQIVLTAYDAYCMNNKITPVLTFDDVCVWLDESAETEAGKKQLADVMKEWSESKWMKKLIAENTEKKSPQQPEIQLPQDTTLMQSNPHVTENSELSPGS